MWTLNAFSNYIFNYLGFNFTSQTSNWQNPFRFEMVTWSPQAELANITVVPVPLIPTENFAMGFYILIIGEFLHQFNILVLQYLTE